MIRAMTVASMLIGTVAFAAPASWSNAGWTYRAQVTAYSPDEERQNPLVEWDADFGDLLARVGAQGTFDANSPRVTRLKAGQENEVPCRFFPDKDAPSKGRLCWLRLGRMPAVTEETFFVYFDVGTSKSSKRYPELARVKPVLGKNLLVNATLTAADPADGSRPAGWKYNPTQAAGTVEWVKGIGHSRDRSLKLSNTAGGTTSVGAQQAVPVEEGKRYALCGWIKTENDWQDGTATMIGWFCGPDGRAVSGPDGAYNNHKLSLSRRGEEPQWTFMSGTSINVYDPKTETNHLLDGDKTLPGTALVNVDLAVCYGKGTASFADLEFRETPTGTPMAIWITAVEKQPNRSIIPHYFFRFRELLRRLLDPLNKFLKSFS